MHIYKLESTTIIHSDIETVWNFFSKPENLNELTPAEMQFEIITPQPLPEMFQGQIIEYIIAPFPFVRFKWTSEITQCEKGILFVDEQKSGPYKYWHHEHRFIIKGSEVHMTDTVKYALPLGFLGRIAHIIFVKKKLANIFTFREEIVQQVFKKP